MIEKNAFYLLNNLTFRSTQSTFSKVTVAVGEISFHNFFLGLGLRLRKLHPVCRFTCTCCPLSLITPLKTKRNWTLNGFASAVM